MTEDTATAALALATVLALSSAGCAALGFSERVLWRLPSPDGEMIAVCQEVPGFDGPGYDIRLQRRDGSLLRSLYGIGDGDPCDELAWSPDGRTLAILSGHVARIRFVDVAWALAHPSVRTAHWSWLQLDLSTERHVVRGRNLRFVGPLIELELCGSNVAGERGVGRECAEPVVTRRYEVPVPIVTGHAPDPGGL